MDRVLVMGSEGSVLTLTWGQLGPTGASWGRQPESLATSLDSTMPANPSPTRLPNHPATRLQMPRPMAAAVGVARRLGDLPICFPGLHLRLTRLQQELHVLPVAQSHLHAAIPALHVLLGTAISAVVNTFEREDDRLNGITAPDREPREPATSSYRGWGKFGLGGATCGSPAIYGHLATILNTFTEIDYMQMHQELRDKKTLGLAVISVNLSDFPWLLSPRGSTINSPAILGCAMPRWRNAPIPLE
ncbi:MAG: hypothetical protein Q9214_002781 [Letrouitia sp. 1 TL-2023]